MKRGEPRNVLSARAGSFRLGAAPGRAPRDRLPVGTTRQRARRLFGDDLAAGAFRVEWGAPADLERAAELDRRYAKLRLGVVDAVVMAVAERLGADAIATLDRRHFGAVTLRGSPRLVPDAG